MPTGAPWRSARTAPAAWRRNWQDCLGLPSLRASGAGTLGRLGLAALAALATASCATSARLAPPSGPAASEVASGGNGGGAVTSAKSATADGAAGAATPAAAGDPGGRPGQWLFRAEISGEEGSGSLRLMLRRLDAERFVLSAADALGQARWEIRRDRDAAIWSDPQGRLYCALDARLPLRARQWVPNFPLSDLPGLLTGEWPPASAVAGAAAPVAGRADRQVTGERAGSGDGAWSSWTIWEEGEPVAWFKRLGADALLSVRRPAVQVRWRVTAQGPLPPSDGAMGDAFLRPGELTSSAREIFCVENAIP